MTVGKICSGSLAGGVLVATFLFFEHNMTLAGPADRRQISYGSQFHNTRPPQLPLQSSDRLV